MVLASVLSQTVNPCRRDSNEVLLVLLQCSVSTTWLHPSSETKTHTAGADMDGDTDLLSIHDMYTDFLSRSKHAAAVKASYT